jgi:hypothetical protein
MHEEIPDFDKFGNSRIFSLLGDIRHFRLHAEIPPIGRWTDDSFAREVVEKLYEYLRGVVQAAGFFHEDFLTSVRRVDGVAVEYRDDRFNFAVECNTDAIVIRRSGSRFSNFHEWYRAFMPSSQGVIENTATLLSEITGRSIDVLTGLYRFGFLLHDLEAETKKEQVRNSEIMQKLLVGFPTEAGQVDETSNELSSLGRIDVSLSRWIGEVGSRRRLVYAVEAPGNLDYSTLWFTFDYIGETYTSPETGQREPFVANEFLTEYVKTYLPFLRDSAINGFMNWLMRGYYFKSSTGNLP